tara:strand:- start:503 stop:730 length:228 start_codon:yes stop_codon:yes gene_type:complete
MNYEYGQFIVLDNESNNCELEVVEDPFINYASQIVTQDQSVVYKTNYKSIRSNIYNNPVVNIVYRLFNWLSDTPV